MQIDDNNPAMVDIQFNTNANKYYMYQMPCQSIVKNKQYPCTVKYDIKNNIFVVTILDKGH